MAASAGSIFVDLLLNDSKYTQGWYRASGTTRRSSSVIQSSISKIGAVVGTALSAQQIIRYSDTFKQLQGRLGLVVTDTQALAGVQQQLFDIAQRTRQPLEGVYNLYTRISQALPEQARASYDLLGVTESINQALAITGEGSAQAASAILQFTQAVASGFQASGQEINALLDSAPRLAQALQRSFGDGTKSLKQLSESGALDLDTILKSLSGVGEEGRRLREEFAKLPPTVGQAFTQLNNSFLQLIGSSEVVTKAVTGLATGISGLAALVGELAKDSNILETSLYGLTDSLIAFYQAYNEQAVKVAESTNFFGLRDEDVKEYQENVDKAIAARDRLGLELLDRKTEVALPLPPPISGPGLPKPTDDKAIAKAAKEIGSVLKSNREILSGLTSEQLKYQDQIEDLNFLLEKGAISQQAYNDALTRAGEQFDQTKDKAIIFGVEIASFGKRAAENIQDAFADFLFDPFEQGLRGMAKGFIDTVRKMIAEAQAAQLSKWLLGSVAGGAGGGLFGDLFGGLFGGSGGGANSPGAGVANSIGGFGGFFADGGFINPGEFGVVGEGGGFQHAEIVMGGRSGATVIPNKAFGNGGNTYNIDARGADQGSLRRIEAALLALAGPGVIEQRVSSAQVRGAI